LNYLTWTLWDLGYPEQAQERINQMLALAQELSHSFTEAYALVGPLFFHQLRREGHATREQAEAVIAFASDRGLPFQVAQATVFRGWALAEQGQGAEGIAEICRGMAAYQAMGSKVNLTYWLGLLVEAYEKTGQTEEGFTILAEALTLVQKTGERRWEAELYRLKGELTLKQFGVQSSELPTP
jgi:predicted ATPase